MAILSNVAYLILLLSSLAFVGALTPIMRKVALRFNVFDKPIESHKTHKTAVPYLGGLAIIFGIILVTYASLVFSNSSSNTLFLAASILVPAVIMGIVGLIDDIRKLSPWPRFITQTTFGFGISLLLVSTDTLGSPFGNPLIDVPLTTLWIVGITNAINFLDNIDGGATGAMAISSTGLFILSWQSEQFLIAAMSIVMSGATFGFLIWNKAPARIYMGDAGALFLGILIASLTIRFSPNPIDRFSSYLIPFLLLAVPILDTTVAVISRVRQGISPFQGGRDHLSHRLMSLNFSKKKAVLTLWLMCTFFSAFAVAISNSSYAYERLLSIISVVCWITLLALFLKLKTLA
jgi:UDP-GlcNAc:undecaprenyl-phosphate GlcNAc-1-phosphate transferase